MKSRALLFIIHFSLLIFLTACGDSLSRTYNVEKSTSIFLASGQPRTLDPATTFGDAAGPIGHIYSGLVTLNPQLEVEPDLAIGWDVSESGETITFFLHPYATFHDGRDVTAQDVVFSWERALAPETQSETALTYLGDIKGAADLANGLAQNLSGVRAINDKTLEVTLEAPRPYFLAKITYPVSFVVDQHQVDDPDWERSPNGTGPFKLEVWQDDRLLILERNQTFYNQPQVKGERVEHVVYLMGDGIPLTMYEQEEIDIVGIGGSNLGRVQDPNDPLTADVSQIVSLCTRFVGINHTQPPFDDVRVRQAFTYALDQNRLIEAFYNNNVLPATGVLPPGIPGYSNVAGYSYDPAKARELLTSAGITDTLELTWTSAGYDDPSGLQTAVISLWEEVLDVKVTAEVVEPFQYNEVLYGRETGHFFNIGWCADYGDPENFLDILFHSTSGQNFGGYTNPSVDSLLETARSEPDTQARLSLYRDIESQIVNDAAYLFIGHTLSSILINERLEGYTHTPIGVPQWHRVTLSE